MELNHRPVQMDRSLLRRKPSHATRPREPRTHRVNRLTRLAHRAPSSQPQA